MNWTVEVYYAILDKGEEAEVWDFKGKVSNSQVDNVNVKVSKLVENFYEFI